MSKEFGTRVINLLRERNKTQKILAAELNLTDVTLSRYLSGEREPGADTVVKIAQNLNTSCDYLLTGKSFDAEAATAQAQGAAQKKGNGADVAVSFAVIAGLILLAIGLGILTDKDKQNLSDMLKSDGGKNPEGGK